AGLDLAGERADPVDGLFGVVGVAGADVDGAVVLDIDGGLGVLGDLADHLAARTDDVADLVGIDLDRGDPRGVLADFLPRLGDDGVHLVEDEQPTFAGLRQGLLQDLLGQPGNLDVHLNGGHAGARAGHFEVHVAQRVFDALDVGEDGVLALGRAVL